MKKKEGRTAGKKAKKIYGFEGAKVFNKDNFDKIKIDEIKVSQVGDLVLSKEEMAVLKLHPKFAIRDKINEGEMEYQGELGWAKLRIRLLKLDSDEEDDLKMTMENNPDEEDDLQEEIEAKSRQFYDPEGKIFNYGKKELRI